MEPRGDDDRCGTPDVGGGAKAALTASSRPRERDRSQLSSGNVYHTTGGNSKTSTPKTASSVFPSPVRARDHPVGHSSNNNKAMEEGTSAAAEGAAAAAGVAIRSTLRTPPPRPSPPPPGGSPSASSSKGKGEGRGRGGGGETGSDASLQSLSRRSSIDRVTTGSAPASARRLFRRSPASVATGTSSRVSAGSSRLSGGSGFSVGSSSSGAANESARMALKAASEGDQKGVLAFLDSGGDVDAKSKTGTSTPLSRAAAKGHVGVVCLLLDRGAAVNIPGRGGLTPLHEAAGCGQVKVCRVLLGAGAAVAARDHSKRCPLHYAGGYASVTKLLLDFGADPEAKDQNDQRPDAMAVDNEARALLRDARCAVREYGVGDNASRVIASLRRELENLEAETEGAKAKAAEEAARRHQMQAEVATLRARMEDLEKEACAARESTSPTPPAAVRRAQLRQVGAALRVAQSLEEKLDTCLKESRAVSIHVNPSKPSSVTPAAAAAEATNRRRLSAPIRLTAEAAPTQGVAERGAAVAEVPTVEVAEASGDGDRVSGDGHRDSSASAGKGGGREGGEEGDEDGGDGHDQDVKCDKALGHVGVDAGVLASATTFTAAAAATAAATAAAAGDAIDGCGDGSCVGPDGERRPSDCRDGSSGNSTLSSSGDERPFTLQLPTKSAKWEHDGEDGEEETYGGGRRKREWVRGGGEKVCGAGRPEKKEEGGIQRQRRLKAMMKKAEAAARKSRAASVGATCIKGDRGREEQGPGFVEQRVGELERQEAAALAAALAAAGTLPSFTLPPRRYTAGVISPRLGSPTYLASKGFSFGSYDGMRMSEGDSDAGSGWRDAGKCRSLESAFRAADATASEGEKRAGQHPDASLDIPPWAPHSTVSAAPALDAPPSATPSATPSAIVSGDGEDCRTFRPNYAGTVTNMGTTKEWAKSMTTVATEEVAVEMKGCARDPSKVEAEVKDLSKADARVEMETVTEAEVQAEVRVLSDAEAEGEMGGEAGAQSEAELVGPTAVRQEPTETEVEVVVPTTVAEVEEEKAEALPEAETGLAGPVESEVGVEVALVSTEVETEEQMEVEVARPSTGVNAEEPSEDDARALSEMLSETERAEAEEEWDVVVDEALSSSEVQAETEEQAEKRMHPKVALSSTVSEVAAQANPESLPEAEVEVEAALPRTVVEATVGAEAKADVGAKTGLVEPVAKVEAEAQAEAAGLSEADAEVEMETETEAEVQAEVRATSGTEGEGEMGAEAGAQYEADAEAEAEVAGPTALVQKPAGTEAGVVVPMAVAGVEGEEAEALSDAEAEERSEVGEDVALPSTEVEPEEQVEVEVEVARPSTEVAAEAQSEEDARALSETEALSEAERAEVVKQSKVGVEEALPSSEVEAEAEEQVEEQVQPKDALSSTASEVATEANPEERLEAMAEAEIKTNVGAQVGLVEPVAEVEAEIKAVAEVGLLGPAATGGVAAAAAVAEGEDVVGMGIAAPTTVAEVQVEVEVEVEPIEPTAMVEAATETEVDARAEFKPKQSMAWPGAEAATKSVATGAIDELDVSSTTAQPEFASDPPRAPQLLRDEDGQKKSIGNGGGPGDGDNFGCDRIDAAYGDKHQTSTLSENDGILAGGDVDASDGAGAYAAPQPLPSIAGNQGSDTKYSDCRVDGERDRADEGLTGGAQGSNETVDVHGDACEEAAHDAAEPPRSRAGPAAEIEESDACGGGRRVDCDSERVSGSVAGQGRKSNWAEEERAMASGVVCDGDSNGNHDGARGAAAPLLPAPPLAEAAATAGDKGSKIGKGCRGAGGDGDKGRAGAVGDNRERNAEEGKEMVDVGVSCALGGAPKDPRAAAAEGLVARLQTQLEMMKARFVELRAENEQLRKAQAVGAAVSGRGGASKAVPSNSKKRRERGRGDNRKAEKGENAAREEPRRRLDAEEQDQFDGEQGRGEWSSTSGESDGASGDEGGVFLRLLQAIQPVSHVYWED